MTVESVQLSQWLAHEGLVTPRRLDDLALPPSLFPQEPVRTALRFHLPI